MSEPAPEVREAATVVILREAPGDDAGAPPLIYMLRRSARSSFMPASLVFPGGRVDPEDGEGDERFATAARRECLEEAGLDLATKRLRWFDTWKTPSAESPRRYVARFYTAFLSADEGDHAEADGEETEDGRWASAGEHLDAWVSGEVDLPPPTLSILLRLAGDDWQSWLERERPELSTPILPKVAAVQNEIGVLLPHDDDYAGTPGDAAPCPPRARDYPCRYIRREGRWLDPSL